MTDNKMVIAIERIQEISKERGVNIHGKIYTMVQDRLEVFRRVWGEEYGIRTEIITQPPYVKNGFFIMKASIVDIAGDVVATGHAVEILGSSTFTTTSFVEVAETSAIGRALASFGLHGGEFASSIELREKEAPNLVPADDPPPATSATSATSSVKKLVLSDPNKPLEGDDADNLFKLIKGAAALAKNQGELTEYWMVNKEALDLLEKSDQSLYADLKSYLKIRMKELPDA